MQDIIVIGSGLSAFAFLKGLKIIGKKISIISYERKIFKNEESDILKTHNNLPPRMAQNRINSQKIDDFYKKNGFILSKDTSIFGYLSHGGVSNYWGCSNEHFNLKNINFLNIKNKNLLKDAFNFFDKNYYHSSKILKVKRIKQFQKNYINLKKKLINNKSKYIDFYNNKTAYDEINKIEFRPKNYFREVDKKIRFLNYFVDSVRKKKNHYEIFCSNEEKKKIFKTRKLILAAGTFSTTRIICEMLNYKKKIKVMHNPMLFGLFISKKSIQNNEINMYPSDLAAKILNKSGNLSSLANFRRSNKIIEDKIFLNFSIFNKTFFKKIYDILNSRLFFMNLYLDSKFSNIFFKFDGNNFKISSDLKLKKKSNQKLKNNFRTIYKYFRSMNLMSFFRFFYIPETGTDNHFVGTIPISNKKKKLGLNENCELNNFKNLYIVDGSCIPKNNLKFPTNLIICNAYRVGKLIK